MYPEQFGINSPGRLEPTLFLETVTRDGKPESFQVSGFGFVPNPLPPPIPRGELLARLYEPLAAGERALNLLEGTVTQFKNPRLLYAPFTYREAVLSSAIEDTFASGQEIAVVDLDPRLVRDREQAREVNNYVKALNHGLTSPLPICLRLIREMHRELLAGVARPSLTPGVFRVRQNAIGRTGGRFKDARFVPPPPEHVDACLTDLERFINSRDELPRLIRLALIHYQFEAIHPFNDGNGRLGRLLITLLLGNRSGGASPPLVYVSGYFERHRQEYYDRLLAVSLQGDWFGWLEYFLAAVAAQATDTLARARQLVKLHGEFHEAVREKRASALLPKLIDQLFVRPSITVKQAAELTGVRATSAGAAVEKLVEKGVLAEVTGRKKDRVFVSMPILSVIDSKEPPE